jgi:hypothetical protein
MLEIKIKGAGNFILIRNSETFALDNEDENKAQKVWKINQKDNSISFSTTGINGDYYTYIGAPQAKYSIELDPPATEFDGDIDMVKFEDCINGAEIRVIRTDKLKCYTDEIKGGHIDEIS